MRFPELMTEPEALLLELGGPKYPGIFMTVEGIEGCGKTTQTALLCEKLVSLGYDVVRTSEPGGTPIGEEVRNLLLRTPSAVAHSREDARMVRTSASGAPGVSGRSQTGTPVTLAQQWSGAAISSTTEALLYAASRAEHVQQVILPALKGGKIVVCDRYVDSSLAYQGGGRELGFDFILSLHDLATGSLFPDLTVLLELDLVAALKRARKGGGDRIEREAYEFHERVLDAFFRIKDLYSERVTAVDASRKKAEVAGVIFEVVQRFLAERGPRE